MSYQLESHGVGKVATCAVNKSAKLLLATTWLLVDSFAYRLAPVGIFPK